MTRYLSREASSVAWEPPAIDGMGLIDGRHWLPGNPANGGRADRLIRFYIRSRLRGLRTVCDRVPDLTIGGACRRTDLAVRVWGPI